MRVSVSPSRRKSKASSAEAPEVKAQVKAEPAVGLAGMVEVVPLLTERANMALSSALVRGTDAEENDPPVMATELTVAAMVSLRSMSVTVIEPVEEREAFVSVRAEVSGPLVMAGVSFVPVRVTATVVVVEAAASEPEAELLSVRVSV